MKIQKKFYVIFMMAGIYSDIVPMEPQSRKRSIAALEENSSRDIA